MPFFYNLRQEYLIINIMKRITLLLSLIFIGMTALSAQTITNGTFHLLVIPQKIDFQIDYSSGVYKGLTFDELRQVECQGENPEKEWTSIHNELKSGFISYFLDVVANQGYSLGTFDESVAKYRLTMHINFVNSKGNITANYTISKIKTGEPVVEFTANSEGGVFGSFINLWGDGMQDAGSVVGKFFIKQIKKCR